MANQNYPFGLRTLGISGGGASATFGTVTRSAPSNASAIFNGDPVMNNATTGYIQKWTAGEINSRLAGIFRGCKYFNTALQRVVWSPYWPGSGATGDVECYLDPIMASPQLEFVVQASGAALTIAEIGCNFDVVMGAGNTTTGQSTTALDSATADTTVATLPFRMIGLWNGQTDSIGADSTASYNWVIVAPNVLKDTGAHV